MTNETRVLLAVDETAMPAAEWVARHYAHEHARVRVVHVAEPSDDETRVASAARYPPPVTQRFDMHDWSCVDSSNSYIRGLGDICKTLASQRVLFDGEVRPQWPHPHVSGRRRRMRLQRDVADEIQDAAADFEPSVIVVAASRRGGTLNVGRTAQAVALTSPCTVVVVKG